MPRRSDHSGESSSTEKTKFTYQRIDVDSKTFFDNGYSHSIVLSEKKDIEIDVGKDVNVKQWNDFWIATNRYLRSLSNRELVLLKAYTRLYDGVFTRILLIAAGTLGKEDAASVNRKWGQMKGELTSKARVQHPLLYCILDELRALSNLGASAEERRRYDESLKNIKKTELRAVLSKRSDKEKFDALRNLLDGDSSKKLTDAFWCRVVVRAILELEKIIRDAPKSPGVFVLHRGYTTNDPFSRRGIKKIPKFTSTSLLKGVASVFGAGEVVDFVVRRGFPVLPVVGLSSFESEMEILLPPCYVTVSTGDNVRRVNLLRQTALDLDLEEVIHRSADLLR